MRRIWARIFGWLDADWNRKAERHFRGTPRPQPPPDDPRTDAILWWILACCAVGLVSGVTAWFARGGGW